MLVFLVERLADARSSGKGVRAGNDPWLADTLEWYTTSPPPAHNFDTVPYVTSARPLRDLRRRLAEQRAVSAASRARALAAAVRRSSPPAGRCSPSSPVRRGLGTTHRLLAALVAPPLAALVVAAWFAHRELVPAVLARRRALHRRGGCARARRARDARGARARRARCSSACARFRGERVPWGSWRDYVALTKPRIMSLLLITGFCGMIAGARGWPGTGLGDRRDGRARACLRRRARAEPRARPRHRPADGGADEVAPGRLGPRRTEPRARVRPRSLRVLVRPAREHGQRADRGARARRQPLLRPRLHALAEAVDAAEHRHRRSRRRRAATRGLGGRDRERRRRGAASLRDRVRLDAAALLGARAPDQGQLRGRRACRCCRSSAATARRRARSCSTRSRSSA